MRIDRSELPRNLVELSFITMKIRNVHYNEGYDSINSLIYRE